MEKPESKTEEVKSASKTTSGGQIVFNVSDTKYAVVRYVGRKLFGWKLSNKHDDMDWDVLWTDGAVEPERLARMKPYQKINHFPGMYALARKNHLARNLMKMRRAHPSQYNFFPKTWLVPAEHADLKAHMTKPGKRKAFIVKPEASCQGRGIFLTKRIEDISPEEHYVVQQYIAKPYLLDGFKFDLRIYVLVAGCDPMRIFVHEEGLARLATEKYVAPASGNIGDMQMHLTNYAINKHSPNFVFNEKSGVDNVGHKRSLTSTMQFFAEQGKDVPALWARIHDMIIKTLCAVLPSLAHTYRSCQPDDPYNSMCFELLGLDVILNSKFKPFLLEVNHSPSFTADTPLDKKIKRQVISEALTLMNVDAKFKRKYLTSQRIEAQERALKGRSAKLTKEAREASFVKAQHRRDLWESEHLGGFTKVYPRPEAPQYQEFIQTAATLWNDWTGGRKPPIARAVTPQSLPTSNRTKVTTRTVVKSKQRSTSNAELPEPEDSLGPMSKRTDVFDRLYKAQPKKERESPTLPIYYPNILPLDPAISRTFETVIGRPKQVPGLLLPRNSGSLIRTLHQALEQQQSPYGRGSPLTVLSLVPKAVEPRPKSEIARGAFVVPRVMSFTPKSQARLQFHM